MYLVGELFPENLLYFCCLVRGLLSSGMHRFVLIKTELLSNMSPLLRQWVLSLADSTH